MTYYDLLDAGIAAVGEDVNASHATEDYVIRGQFILASFVTKYASLDGVWRRAHKMSTKSIKTDMVSIDPDDDFPLCEVFIPVAVNYLASGLVIDEDEEMSDKFFDRYINGILDIRKELPAEQSAIADKYGLD